MKCQKCGAEHENTGGECCGCSWIDCICGEQICGNCGSTDILRHDSDDDDEDLDEAYWCNCYCKDCGLNGCGDCI